MASQTTTRAIPLLDLRRQFDPIREEVMREVERVIESKGSFWARMSSASSETSRPIAAALMPSGADPEPMRWNYLCWRWILVPATRY